MMLIRTRLLTTLDMSSRIWPTRNDEGTGPHNDEMTVNRTEGPSEALHGVNNADPYSTTNYTIPRHPPYPAPPR
jgi:hypothetical protein